ncbi:hypothetical protein AVEN_258388-1 [Araneus ventricosus]|uniref:Tc1-like transposase DDE domain-containing protein n=1 Tax=Araneus ventricosus TaxID=182803 RepID=A0A4Y2UYU2_ARAVE|nr:hypothetical protein AVEN_272733-1 [Araneus ventricosus]GBN81226.1 hypothetical protein AVEN_97602-1 [Araneus ventricosus]GBO16780.1 hypothetical protein AVEN_258388-1 [Araneus ventricosus]
MKSPEYVSLLGYHLIPSVHYFFPESDGIFRDDNARSHRARIVGNWFQDHESSFEHLIWPPQSLDLSPIENLSDVLERALRDDTNLPPSIEDLGSKLMLLWPKIYVQKSYKLIESMPKIMCAVIRAKASPTKF